MTERGGDERMSEVMVVNFKRYVPESDLRAARERNEQLERGVRDLRVRWETAEGWSKHVMASLGLPDDGDLFTRIEELKRELSESRARLTACEEVISRLQEWTHIMGEALVPRGADSYGEGVRDCKAQVANMLMAALSKLDAAHPAPPRAVDPDQVKREPGCQCHWEVGDSPCRVHGEEEPAPAEAKGDERAEDAHLAKARELYDLGYRTDAVGHLLAHLEQQRATAPSKPADGECDDVEYRFCPEECAHARLDANSVCDGCGAVLGHNKQPAAAKPSEADGRDWHMPWSQEANRVYSRYGVLVAEVCSAGTAAFIVTLANRWHAEQGGEGQ